MALMAVPEKSFDALLAEQQLADPSFRAEWQRLAPAREFAATLLRYRAEHKLSQRALAAKLGVSQPRVVKLESGEHNPEVDTIINAVRRLGIEFVLDVAPGRVFRGTVRSIGYGVTVKGSSDPRGELPTVSESQGWLRDTQRFPVVITLNGDEARGYRRAGGQADVVVFTGSNGVLNTIAKLRIRLACVLSYVR